jgi:hypothetical protein
LPGFRAQEQVGDQLIVSFERLTINAGDNITANLCGNTVNRCFLGAAF